MRLAAQAKGGFYPTPSRVVDLVSKLLYGARGRSRSVAAVAPNSRAGPQFSEGEHVAAVAPGILDAIGFPSPSQAQGPGTIRWLQAGMRRREQPPAQAGSRRGPSRLHLQRAARRLPDAQGETPGQGEA